MKTANPNDPNQPEPEQATEPDPAEVQDDPALAKKKPRLASIVREVEAAVRDLEEPATKK